MYRNAGMAHVVYYIVILLFKYMGCYFVLLLLINVEKKSLNIKIQLSEENGGLTPTIEEIPWVKEEEEDGDEEEDLWEEARSEAKDADDLRARQGDGSESAGAWDRCYLPRCTARRNLVVQESEEG